MIVFDLDKLELEAVGERNYLIMFGLCNILFFFAKLLNTSLYLTCVIIDPLHFTLQVYSNSSINISDN